MRQRTTFFHRNEDAIDPASLKVSGRTLSGPDIKAVREDRFTLGLDELPAELQELLRLSQELYIRWTSPVPYQAIGPWSSRLSPGLHVFYTPQADTGANVASNDELCLLLRRLGPVECASPYVCKPSCISCVLSIACSHIVSIEILLEIAQRSILPFNRVRILPTGL